MRLLLLNLNYLRYHFFIKTMHKNIIDFEHPMLWGKKRAKCSFTGKYGLLKTYFLPLMLTFTPINSELRKISNDKITLNYLIIKRFRYH